MPANAMLGTMDRALERVRMLTIVAEYHGATPVWIAATYNQRWQEPRRMSTMIAAPMLSALEKRGLVTSTLVPGIGRKARMRPAYEITVAGREAIES